MNTISRLEAIRQFRERVETVLSTDDVIEGSCPMYAQELAC